MQKNPTEEDIRTIDPVSSPKTNELDRIREYSRLGIFFSLFFGILLLDLCAAIYHPTQNDLIWDLLKNTVNALLVLLGTAIGFYFRGTSRRQD